MAPRRPKVKGRSETPQERLLRNWSAFTTRCVDTSTISVSERAEFFQDAHELVYANDGIRQSVIHSLASNTGLERIGQLITDTELTAEQLHSTVIPFLKVIGHPKVLSSRLLEPYLATVYDALYEQNGSSTIRLYVKYNYLIVHAIDVRIPGSTPFPRRQARYVWTISMPRWQY